MISHNQTSSHSTYLAGMINGLQELCGREPSAAERLLQESELVLLVAMLDLTPLRGTLESYYSPQHRGEGAYDPCTMFRSFVVLSKLGRYSLRKWPKYLEGHPEMALLCGFSLGAIAQKTCHYDFCKRLLNGPYQKECVHEPRASRALEGRGANFLRALKREKELAKEELKAAKLEPDEQRVKQAVREALERKNRELPPTFIQRMNELLWDCAVIPSLGAYLEASLKELAVSGDSSSIYTQASSKGKVACECKQEGKETCDCPRRYADPEATWGYDSKEERYFFGHRLHTLDTRADDVDLPLYVAVTDAHTPDAVITVESLPHLVQLCERATEEWNQPSLSTQTETTPTETETTPTEIRENDPTISLQEQKLSPRFAEEKADDEGRWSQEFVNHVYLSLVLLIQLAWKGERGEGILDRMYQNLALNDEMSSESPDKKQEQQNQKDEEQAELSMLLKQARDSTQGSTDHCSGCTGGCDPSMRVTTETPATPEPNGDLRQTTKPVRVTAGIFDKAYDATEFYRFLHEFDIAPIIPLRVAPKMNANEMPRNSLGIPLCKAGLAMKFHGNNKKRKQSTYHCPVKYVGRENGKLKIKVRPEGCPLGELCEPNSVMGPLVYLPLDENYRLNVPIPRDSERFATLLAKRTASERLFSQRRSLGYFSRPFRRRYLYQVTAIAHAVACHVRAWVWQRWGKKPVQHLDELFGRLHEVLNIYQQKEANIA